MTNDCVKELMARLRADPRSAMQGRQSEEVSVLRALIAAIDNAQAVAVGDLHERYLVREFGDRSVEVPRRELSNDDLQNLLKSEIADRRAAADEYYRANRGDRAENLSREIAIITRYLGRIGGR